MIAPLILTLFATAYANVIIDLKCPEFKPIENFNFSAYGTGVWREVARYPNEYEEEDIKCDRGVYTIELDYSSTRNVLVQDGKEIRIDGVIRKVTGAGNTGELVGFISLDNWKMGNTFYILDTDYDNYAITYTCKYDEGKKSRRDYVWILSRSKTLSADVKTKIQNFMKSSGYLDYDKLIWPETSCNE
ncbi:unnamed protein product [Danaus chrysippus]|uniref:(African queen) hypothetical protein n=1 Tax=Danaus chrysippus TaxID=151541 RepID=A0A8J2WEL8_9NEOP|nr:unnamed protein product [Danaus chrysippus]